MDHNEVFFIFCVESPRKVVMKVFTSLTRSAIYQVTTRFFIVNPKAALGTQSSAQGLVHDAIESGKLGFLKN